MQIYDDAAKQVVGIILAGVVTAVVKWHGDRRTARAARHQETITIHDTVTQLQNNLDRVDDWIKGVEVVGRDMIEKFKGGNAINAADIAALKRELDQRPEIGKE